MPPMAETEKKENINGKSRRLWRNQTFHSFSNYPKHD